MINIFDYFGGVVTRNIIALAYQSTFLIYLHFSCFGHNTAMQCCHYSVNIMEPLGLVCSR